MTVTTTQIYVGVTTEFSVGGSGIFGKFTFGGTAGASPKLVNTYLQGGYTYYTYSVLSASVGTLTVTDSSSASATINFVVAAPADPTLTPGNGQVAASWATGVPGAANYRLYRNGSRVYNSSGGSYTDTGLTNGTTYTYTLSAVDSSGVEAFAPHGVSATPKVPVNAIGGAANATPSDTVDLVFQARETRASFTGNMQVAVAGSTTPVLIPMAAGVPLVLPITRIYATNTSSGTIAVLS
jgi:chitodextrinase